MNQRFFLQISIAAWSLFSFLTIPSWEMLLCSSLDGTSGIVYKTQHHVFSNGESARGFVAMRGGFTVKPGAIATLDTIISVSGSIDLREIGRMTLVADLKLESGLTWSSGGYIKGKSKSIVLGGDLVIPASKTIHFQENTIIDGQGHTLLLQDHAQVFVENNATLTLRNLVIRNTRDYSYNSFVRAGGPAAKICLDNTTLALANDIVFGQGQLYIHNDVMITGTSAFIYASTSPCFVAPASTFLFDIGTTFSFTPPTSLNNLFVLQDRTSTLYLDGCSFNVSSTGARLTKGNLIFQNKVSLEANGLALSNLVAVTSASYGQWGAEVKSVSWHPNGRFLAIGGYDPLPGYGQFNDNNELRLYTFDGASLSPLTSVDYGTSGYVLIRGTQWHPTGNFLAINGQNAAAVGGFGSANELRVYSFDGFSLTALTSQNLGTGGDVQWNSNGTVLACGDNATLRLYSFNGLTLTALTTASYSGGSFINTIAWHPSQSVIAIGGYFNAGVQLFSFNGTSLSSLTSQSYGYEVNSVAWNPDGTVLAFGGGDPTNYASLSELQLFTFNGSTLTALTSINIGDYPGTTIHSIKWSQGGTILSVSGQAYGGNEYETRFYQFNGSSLTELFTLDYGTNPNLYASIIQNSAWDPTEAYFVTVGFNPSPTAEFNNYDQIRIYRPNFTATSSVFSNPLIFGNSTLGSDYDLNVEVFGGAHVTVKCKLQDDSA